MSANQVLPFAGTAGLLLVQNQLSDGNTHFCMVVPDLAGPGTVTEALVQPWQTLLSNNQDPYDFLTYLVPVGSSGVFEADADPAGPILISDPVQLVQNVQFTGTSSPGGFAAQMSVVLNNSNIGSVVWLSGVGFQTTGTSGGNSVYQAGIYMVPASGWSVSSSFCFTAPFSLVFDLGQTANPRWGVLSLQANLDGTQGLGLTTITSDTNGNPIVPSGSAIFYFVPVYLQMSACNCSGSNPCGPFYLPFGKGSGWESQMNAGKDLVPASGNLPVYGPYASDLIPLVTSGCTFSDSFSGTIYVPVENCSSGLCGCSGSQALADPLGRRRTNRKTPGTFVKGPEFWASLGLGVLALILAAAAVLIYALGNK